ncbi:MAG: hypothetical protein U0807_01125 [Candidatus Binatia bacterium]
MSKCRRAGWPGLVVLGLVAWLSSSRDAGAFHTVFSYRVDRFELDGNVAGPADGIPDLVDEFDDGALSPNWYRAYGTASEMGGFLDLTNPGAHFPGPNGEAFDLTVVGSLGALIFGDNRGDVTGTAYWEARPPEVGHHYHFSVFTWGQTPQPFSETFGIGIRRSDTALEIEQHLTELDQYNGVWRNTMLSFFAISADDITGRIGFRIAFDDTTNIATTSYSLDGGATWHSPFRGGEIFVGRSAGQFLLSADPSTAVPIPPGPCTPVGCRRSIVPAKNLLKVLHQGNAAADLLDWKWRKGQSTTTPEFGDPLGTTTYEVCIGDAAGNPVFRVEIPPGGTCGGTACWSRLGRKGYKYKNPGGRISQLRLTGGGDGRAVVTVKGKGVALAPPSLPLGLPATVRVKNASGACWAGVFNTAGVVQNTATQFQGKGSSPGGAFLD